MSRLRGAAAGAVAAGVWAALEPVDQRVFRFGYSDVALLGKAVTRGPGWRRAGLVAHCVNGAGAGVLYTAVAPRLRGRPVARGVQFAMVEHVLSYPLTTLGDRFHPARGDADLPPMARSRRAFAQATFRHLVFGIVLGALAGAPARRREPGAPIRLRA
jgi:hypothetical protein